VEAVGPPSSPQHRPALSPASLAPSPAPPRAEDDEVPEAVAAYMTGEKKAPIPTFFLGGWGRGARAALAAQAAGKGNVWHLGRSGIRDVLGMKVAFLDGTYDGVVSTQPAADEDPAARHYSKTDVEALSVLASQATDVDFFLTAEWPRGVAAAVPGGKEKLPEGVAGCSDGGSAAVARLAEELRPRYHIAGGPFWQRNPYLNRDMGTGSHVTRFISLAEVDNGKKQRSLHALGVTPAAEMSHEALTQRPADTTASPYDASLKRAREDDASGDQSWRWQEKRQRAERAAPSRGKKGVIRDHTRTVFLRNLPYTAGEEDVVAFFAACGTVEDYRRGAQEEGKINSWALMQFTDVEGAEKACAMAGQKLMGREIGIDMSQRKVPGEGRPVDGCWFCLSNPTASTWLVVSVGQQSYVAMDKCPIEPMHVQIVPIEHFPSSLSLPEAAHHEFERYCGAVRSMYAADGKLPLMFERYMVLRKKGGNHMQVNLVPVVPAAAERARDFIAQMGEAAGIKKFEVFEAEAGEQGRQAMRRHVGDMEFIAFTLPDGTRMVHVIRPGEKHPMGFVREVAAALAGKPDKADWKKCEVGREAEEQAAEELRAAFGDYDLAPAE